MTDQVIAQGAADVLYTRIACVAFPAIVGCWAVPLLADGVTDFGCSPSQGGSIVSADKIEAAYAMRSVAIIQAALAMNEDRLKSMVAPTAMFTEWQGDAGTSLAPTGSEAAVRFWTRLSPRSYQYSVAFSGPFGGDPCKEVSSKLMLLSDFPDRAIAATFTYRNGLLVAAAATRVSFARGEFAR